LAQGKWIFEMTEKEAPQKAGAEGAVTLVHYDAMCRAITQAYVFDDVKIIRDKAIALEH
jgi:hypothetical protein